MELHPDILGSLRLKETDRFIIIKGYFRIRPS
jgi:hypothetical protein